jgi:4-hydroxy-tetrahydrodipicolinate synthase
MSKSSNRLTGDSAGVFVIAATPFEDNGALDLSSTDNMIDFYLGTAADGLTVLGMMGEAGKLSPEESTKFLNQVLARVAGRIPVVVGVSNAGTDNLISFAHQSMEAGAAGVMIAPLSTLRTEEQVVGYFAEIGARLDRDVPVVLQDFPQVTGVVMSVPTIERVLECCPQVVCFKHEDCPGLGKLSNLRRNDEKRRRISILVGNNGLFLPQELARGADGAMTGFAYPEMMVGVCRAFKAGNANEGEDLFDMYLPLVRYESQPGLGLAIRKEVLRRRGAIRSAHVRAPGSKLSAADHAELGSLLKRLETNLADRSVSASAD